MKKTKKLVAFLAATAVMGATMPIMAQQDVKIYVNNELVNFDGVQPYIESGRTLAPMSTDTTMVPLRAVFEKLGCSVEWQDNVVDVKSGDTNIRIGNGGVIYRVPGEGETSNSCTILPDVSPVLKDGKMMIPLRLAMELIGQNVMWDGLSKSVYVGASKSNDIMFGSSLLKMMGDGYQGQKRYYVADVDKNGDFEYIEISPFPEPSCTVSIFNNDENGNMVKTETKELPNHYLGFGSCDELINYLNSVNGLTLGEGAPKQYDGATHHITEETAAKLIKNMYGEDVSLKMHGNTEFVFEGNGKTYTVTRYYNSSSIEDVEIRVN